MCVFQSVYCLTLYLNLNLLNFFNRIIHLPILELSIIILRDIKIKTCITARMCRLAWLYTGGKG